MISDGNQNHHDVDLGDINAISKEVITLSWLIYMELKARTNLAKQNANNDLPVDVIEQYTLRINELENLVSFD